MLSNVIHVCPVILNTLSIVQHIKDLMNLNVHRILILKNNNFHIVVTAINSIRVKMELNY